MGLGEGMKGSCPLMTSIRHGKNQKKTLLCLLNGIRSLMTYITIVMAKRYSLALQHKPSLLSNSR